MTFRRLLALRHDGCLATFDRGISLASVPAATAANLQLVGATP